MALLLVAAAIVSLVEMPAQVSARLHEQQQESTSSHAGDNAMRAENFMDYDYIIGEVPPGENAPSSNAVDLAADQSDAQNQHHRRLQDMKNEWPECIGMQAEDCVALVESEAPDVYTIVVRPREYDFHRVIIRVDNDDLVTQTPYRG